MLGQIYYVVVGGGRVKGMTEIAYDEFSIKQKLGARVVNLDEKEMTEKVAAMSDEEAAALLAQYAFAVTTE